MANTPLQNQAAITAAIQAAAVADLALMNAFATANGPTFTAVEANLATLAGQMSSNLRQQAVLSIQAQLASALASFNTLVSMTNNSQTAIPVA